MTTPDIHSHKPSLDAIGIRTGIDQSTLKHGYLGYYETEIRRIDKPLHNMAIISGVNPVSTANTFAEWLPDTTVHLLGVGEISEAARAGAKSNVEVYDRMNVGAMHHVMASLPNLQLIVEDGTNQKSHKRDCFRQLLFHLDDKGVYACEDLHATYIDKFVDDADEDVWSLVSRIMHYKLDAKRKIPAEEKDDKALSDAIGGVTSYGKLLFVSKSGSHAYKLREYEANAVLETRYGDTWGCTLDTLPAETLDDDGVATVNRRKLAKRFRASIEAPALHLREYKSVSYAPGQVLYKDGLVLPDAFRHPLQPRLYNRFLQDDSHHHAKIRPGSRPMEKLDGHYFYLDTEYPSYYGHVTTEIISRLWAWKEAKRLYPDIKAIVSPKEGAEDIPGYEREILGAFGINDSDIMCIDKPAIVESVLAATPMFANPKYVNARVRGIWNTIRDNLRNNSDNRPSHIFVNRPAGLARECRNGEAVVDLFREHGYEVINPENMTLGDQVDTFARAKVVAGFGGSGMLNSIFSDGPGTKIVVAPNTYNARNEYLISAVNRDRIHYFYGESEIQHPPKRWTWRAYRSPFTFDLGTDGKELRPLLERL